MHTHLYMCVCTYVFLIPRRFVEMNLCNTLLVNQQYISVIITRTALTDWSFFCNVGNAIFPISSSGLNPYLKKCISCLKLGCLLLKYWGETTSLFRLLFSLTTTNSNYCHAFLTNSPEKPQCSFYNQMMSIPTWVDTVSSFTLTLHRWFTDS